MDWTVFVVFILSITRIECGITLEEINEAVAATRIPSLTDSTTIDKEAEQSTTAATTFVEEDKKNTTLENVVEGGNKNTTSEISGDIDVYYGFQATPVIVKVLGDDGRFHWYLTKEGVGDTQKNYYQNGLNNNYYPQGYF
ncbi:uncharacterized protein LOC120349139, partial [Nilaparvata lugens]|uniref:uncharacterized protein LOC120349139 n=1 Tax=Nilaparvata lugens TaxID=108931 RepID=UPI00193D6B28